MFGLNDDEIALLVQDLYHRRVAHSDHPSGDDLVERLSHDRWADSLGWNDIVDLRHDEGGLGKALILQVTQEIQLRFGHYKLLLELLTFKFVTGLIIQRLQLTEGSEGVLNIPLGATTSVIQIILRALQHHPIHLV
ncbi:MAG: hypothetical protein HYV15_00385 [Elusimicrobia bacterium]|nr:hypothetical protein [Elusimicrobiota bacterium]